MLAESGMALAMPWLGGWLAGSLLGETEASPAAALRPDPGLDSRRHPLPWGGRTEPVRGLAATTKKL